jgi:hypothetical protein
MDNRRTKINHYEETKEHTKNTPLKHISNVEEKVRILHSCLL